MSQKVNVEELEEEKVNVEELGQEEILSLLKEAQKNEPEAKYILEVERYNRPDLHERLETVYGTAEIIPVSKDNQTGTATEIVIPKTSPTVIIKRTRSDYPQYNGEIEIFVFLADKGWVRLS